MYLVVTTYNEDSPFYCLYKTFAAAKVDFWERVGEYIRDYLLDCTVSGSQKVNMEEASHIFRNCYIEEDEYYIDFDGMEIYIDELEVKD